MNGRQETNLRYKTMVVNKLNNYPQYITDYYYYIAEKTDSTKLIYMNKIMSFVDYLIKAKMIDNSSESLKNLKLSVVMKYIEDVQYKPNGDEVSTNTKCVTLFALKSFFRFLQEEAYITENISSKIKIPKIYQDKQILYLNNDEIGKLLKYALDNGEEKWKFRDISMMCLGFFTGLRISAICEINLEDIDFQKQTIQVTEKGNKQRTIFINETTTNFLRQWCEKRNQLLNGYDNIDALFFGKKRKRLTNSSSNNIVSRYTKKIFGRTYSPHKMRSSCATNLYEATGDLFLAQNQLGHANPRTTMRYTSISQEKMKQATEILDNLVTI